MNAPKNVFLKYLYREDFGYYEPIITYELVLGYEMTTLEIRRDLATLLLLRDIVNTKINPPKLLERIYFHIPSRVNRKRRNIFCIQSARTNHFRAIYGEVENLDHTVDIFYDSSSAFKSKVLGALLRLRNK